MAKTKLRTDNIDLSGSTEALELPIGTTAQRQFSVEYLIVAAANDAKSKLKKKTSEEISKVTGGIDLPPGFKLPF